MKERDIQPLLNELENYQDKVEELECKIARLEERKEWEWDWRSIRKASPGNLPVPRLELRHYVREGRDQAKWMYFLVYEHLEGDILANPMGMTEYSSGREFDPAERIKDEPYRESANIRADMKSLDLPGYIICDPHVMQINSENRDQVHININEGQ